jgi:hypothetical protein
MTVKVIKFRVNTGKAKFSVGQLVEGVSDKEEQKLVDSGVCEFVQVVQVQTPSLDPDNNSNSETDPEGNSSQETEPEEDGPATSLPDSSSTKKSKK